MDVKDFIFCTRHKLFDVRHLMLLGFAAMLFSVMFVANTNIQARQISGEVQVSSALGSSDKAPAKVAMLKIPAAVIADEAVKTTSPQMASTPTISIDKYLKKLGLAKKDEKLTKLASLNSEETYKFSPAARKSCGVEAARAAANGDTSKISPCITALLSGDEDAMLDLPNKMRTFFIEAANDPDKAKNMPMVMMNSMLAMMGALTNTVDEANAKEEAANAKEAAAR